MNAERPMQKYLERAEQRQQQERDAQPSELGFQSHPEAPSLMLDLVLADGCRHGMPYSGLSAVKFGSDGVLTLEFPGHTVTISGRGLLPLYRHVLLHLAREIIASVSGMDDGKEACWVKAINVVAVKA